MKYKIGDVARILGVSPDILRYYEKKGVVTPMKGENNDYRYYDAWDINFLMDCLWFKNFGFSIEQIADIVRIPSISELDGILDAMKTAASHMPRVDAIGVSSAGVYIDNKVMVDEASSNLDIKSLLLMISISL